MVHFFEIILKKYKNVLAIRNKIVIKACYLKGKRFLATFWYKYGVDGIQSLPYTYIAYIDTI